MTTTDGHKKRKRKERRPSSAVVAVQRVFKCRGKKKKKRFDADMREFIIYIII
jgi:hypothetical protein